MHTRGKIPSGTTLWLSRLSFFRMGHSAALLYFLMLFRCSRPQQAVLPRENRPHGTRRLFDQPIEGATQLEGLPLPEQHIHDQRAPVIRIEQFSAAWTHQHKDLSLVHTQSSSKSVIAARTRVPAETTQHRVLTMLDTLSVTNVEERQVNRGGD